MCQNLAFLNLKFICYEHQTGYRDGGGNCIKVYLRSQITKIHVSVKTIQYALNWKCSLYK